MALRADTVRENSIFVLKDIGSVRKKLSNQDPFWIASGFKALLDESLRNRVREKASVLEECLRGTVRNSFKRLRRIILDERE
jgi:hypothetical protein